MRLSLERKITLGFASSLVVMLLVAGAAIWNVRSLQGTFHWVDHTHGVINRLETSLTDMLSMQTSTRGFVLTGSEDILRPHQAGVARLPILFQELRTLLADNAGQLQRLQQATQAAEQARTIMAERIAARRHRGLASAADTAEFLRGQAAVESFRATVEEMKVEERRLLDGRFGRTHQAARATGLTIVVAVGLATALIGLAIYVVRRDFIRRREAESERDQVFELSRDMICVAGFDGYFRRLNPAWQATLGFSNAELQAKKFVEFVHPDDRETTLAEAMRLARGEESILFENRYACRDGSYRWLSWSARPVMGKQTIIATARDITERRESFDRIQKLNGELETRAAQLEAANRELESFSYSVSHDLRAPLRHIDGFAGLLAKRNELTFDVESRRFISTISRAAKQMGVLIDDLLAFSRFGRVPLRHHWVDQDALVAHVIADGVHGSAERPIEWQIGPLAKVQADGGLLRQVWSNLIQNAVKYSGKSAHPRITIGGRADSEQKEYVFFVRDNGVGFDMAYADKLFGVFQRLHSPTEFEGTGIGLANVRRIVSRHGGRTWAEARVDEGATFYFSLPIEPPPPSNSSPPFKASPA